MVKPHRLIVLVFFLVCKPAFCQSPDFRKEAHLLQKLLQSNHFNPPPADDKFSTAVYKNFIDRLDPHRLYFTSDDLKILSASRNSIDNDLNGESFSVLSQFTKVFQKSLARAAVHVDEVTKMPFDFNTKENLMQDTSWSADAKSNQERWRLSLKAELLGKLFSKQEQLKSAADQSFFNRYEPELRERVRKSHLRTLHRLLDDTAALNRFVAIKFFRAVTAAYDPHSIYFSPTEIENYLASLSTKGYYFGFTMEQNESGEFVISELVPGGPAWNSGVIHTGDIIQQIQLPGHEAVEFDGLDEDEANEMLTVVNNSEVQFTLNSVEGKTIKVQLQKEKLEDPENVVKSFVLHGKNTVGYISLPGFYTTNEDGGSQCANDVAREILKLKKENVEGLILDVRFNGGGSLKEALAMAGIFIDAGPVALLKEKTGEVITMKDMNRGTVYDGPLVMMVNGMSASASEILAAAMQDYNRALIVGSQTFGKATAQHVLPLNENIKTDVLKSVVKSGVGFSTVTMEKVYRITGKTAQCRGVRPDIEIPEITRVQYHERDLPRALVADSVNKKVYYQAFPPIPKQELISKSEQRTLLNEKFKTLTALEKKLMAEEQSSVPLNWQDFRKYYIQKKQALDDLAMASKPSVTFTIANPIVENQRMGLDNYMKNFTGNWIKKLSTDVALEEVYLIMCDFILLRNTK